MYPTPYDTHNNLSAIADQKSNLMLSINTLMIAIILRCLFRNQMLRRILWCLLLLYWRCVCVRLFWRRFLRFRK